MSLLKKALELAENSEFEAASVLLTPLLNENFDDHKVLFLLGHCLLKKDCFGLAYTVLKRASELFPGEENIWVNMGLCYHGMQQEEKADECFRHALKCQSNSWRALEALGLTAYNRADYRVAIEYCNRAIAEDQELHEARLNRGMSYLALKRWREGWIDFNRNIGKDKNRIEFIYGNEVRWDGTKGLDVVCYGEQGIGDEISFASCLPDLIRDSRSVTIECDKRLKYVFRRSFPTCEVHGTRYKKDEVPEWRSHKPYQARVSIGALPQFYRNRDGDFPGTPYLVPNPQMALQWRTLLDSLGPRPKIGLAWTGGIPGTGQRKRSVTLDTLAPLFGFDADWISLQYKDIDGIEEAEHKYGVKIHDWDWGVRCFDYDQTIALISQLDLVISVTTTVVHAAGALGKECWCLVSSQPIWRYLAEGEWFPWAKSVTLYRQKGNEWPIHLLLGKLKDRFRDHHRRPEHRSSEIRAVA